MSHRYDRCFLPPSRFSRRVGALHPRGARETRSRAFVPRSGVGPAFEAGSRRLPPVAPARPLERASLPHPRLKPRTRSPLKRPRPQFIGTHRVAAVPLHQGQRPRPGPFGPKPVNGPESMWAAGPRPIPPATSAPPRPSPHPRQRPAVHTRGKKSILSPEPTVRGTYNSHRAISEAGI